MHSESRIATTSHKARQNGLQRSRTSHRRIKLCRGRETANHYQHVTQPLLLEQLDQLGIDISARQLNGILTEKKDIFHDEKTEVLLAGLEVSSYVQVDDTGARHQGHNGFCTHIGNELFAYFESTDSKSRQNFLEVLRGDFEDMHSSIDSAGWIR